MASKEDWVDVPLQKGEHHDDWADVDAPADNSDISQGESFGRGAGQTATLGFQDEISPLFERGFAKLFGDQATQDLYDSKSNDQLRDTYRDQNDNAQQANPLSYLGGQLVGGARLLLERAVNLSLEILRRMRPFLELIRSVNLKVPMLPHSPKKA
jgi:hypothetical protein